MPRRLVHSSLKYFHVLRHTTKLIGALTFLLKCFPHPLHTGMILILRHEPDLRSASAVRKIGAFADYSHQGEPAGVRNARCLEVSGVTVLQAAVSSI